MPVVAIRAWSPTHSSGVLYWGDIGADAEASRFEPDDGGAGVAFRWTATATGRQQRWPTRPTDREEERRWQRFVTTEGETLLFRRDGPPPQPAATGTA